MGSSLKNQKVTVFKHRSAHRVAVPLEVEERKTADVANALDVHGERAHEFEDLRRAARQRN